MICHASGSCFAAAFNESAAVFIRNFFRKIRMIFPILLIFFSGMDER
jgi:hypothetical protein